MPVVVKPVGRSLCGRRASHCGHQKACAAIGVKSSSLGSISPESQAGNFSYTQSSMWRGGWLLFDLIFFFWRGGLFFVRCIGAFYELFAHTIYAFYWGYKWMGRELRKKYVGEGSRESRFMVAYSVLSQYFTDSGRSVVHCSTMEH